MVIGYEMRHFLSNNLRLILIGFQVFYYLIKDCYLVPAKDYDTKGYEGGRDGENFPADITTDFLLFASNSQDGYEIYRKISINCRPPINPLASFNSRGCEGIETIITH